MADKVHFELVSPEKLMLSEEVDMVVIPGSEGDFGVLPQHAPLITSIRPGVIDVYSRGHVSESIFIAGGFCEVTEAGCTVLAEEATLVDAINPADAEARLATAREALVVADSPAARSAAESRIASAEAMIEAARRH